MPSDGYADWEPTTDPRPNPAGRTTYAQPDGGAATFVRQRSPQAAEGHPVDSPVAGWSEPSASTRPVWPQSATSGTAYPDRAHPDGAVPDGVASDDAFLDSAYPDSGYHDGAYPDSAYADDAYADNALTGTAQSDAATTAFEQSVSPRPAGARVGAPPSAPGRNGAPPSAPGRSGPARQGPPNTAPLHSAPPNSAPPDSRPPNSAPPRPDLPLRPSDPPGAAPPPGAPPGAKQPNRKWWLALIAIVAVLVGATAAVLAQRDTAEPATDAQGTPGVSPQAGDRPGSTPSGRSGLGASPSVPGATPSAGGDSTPDPAPFRPGVRRTLPGATIQLLNGESFEQGLARSDRSFGPLRMVRVFYPGLPPKWTGSRSDVVDRTVVVSFKAPPREINSGRDDARIAAWFASIPRQYDVYWAYYHEPENDVERGAFTPAEFKAAWRRVAGLANRAGNPRLINTVILMCFTLVPGSHRDFNAYYPGNDLVETLGWDCYNHATKTNRYNPPEAIYARAAAKSRELGKPWGIAETGTTRTKGDSGTGRAAWIRSVMNYLNAQRPLWVTYYNANRAGGDFRLTDAPSMQAWKTWCTATPAP